MPDNTDATTEAKTVTEPVEAEKTTTEETPVPESDGRSAEDRIKGLTAQLAREKEAKAKLEERMQKIEEANKSEEEKRIEERAKELHGDKLQRLESIETSLAEKRDALLETVPEEHRGLIDENADVFKQIQQIEGVTALLNKAGDNSTPPPTGGGVNPKTEQKQHYSWQEWEQFTALGASHDAEDRAEYKKRKADMFAALKDGRVEDSPRRAAPMGSRRRSAATR